MKKEEMLEAASDEEVVVEDVDKLFDDLYSTSD